ncbi:MAG: hypothetical protein VX777_07810 [Chlamydiota bacterium]|nr:hypothetical protein [Chlamydiota bacterium]
MTEASTPIETSTTVTSTDSVSTDSSSSSSERGEITAATKFSSIGDFREKAPELFDKWMETISQNIIDDMKKGAERMKKAMRKNREI